MVELPVYVFSHVLFRGRTIRLSGVRTMVINWFTSSQRRGTLHEFTANKRQQLDFVSQRQTQYG